MDQPLTSPEELIRGMQPDEICELLEEIGIELSLDEATLLQHWVERLGTVDAALDQLVRSDEEKKPAA